jgi:hypothetical protein
VRHARDDALDQLEADLLPALRACEQLVERSRGVFYLRSKAFLHFHEDPSGLFADVRLSDDFERFDVTEAAQRTALLERVRAVLS